MLGYCFTVHDSGTKSEDLGGMGLTDDGEARAFGKQVIRDLIRTDAARYSGWTMDITEGARAVGSIPFEVHAVGDHPKK